MATKTQGRKISMKPDLASLGGLIVALAGIVGGLILEGGKVSDISQVTAAIIVLGGTLGAVMLTTPMPILLRAARGLGQVFFEREHPRGAIIEDIIMLANKARKNGIVSLETDVEAIEDPFLRKALSLAVDGTDLQELRRMMELEVELEEQAVEAEAKVYEVAGGYAPTIGIIGAVLGLIQVMKNLANIDEVGHGIAVAFVATVYGVGLANLFFLPVGSKIKARLHHSVKTKDLMLEGVCSIVEGMNPKLIRIKLEAFMNEGERAPEKDAAAEKGTVRRTAPVQG